MATKAREHTRREVIVWRREQLVRAGFHADLAARLSREGSYDLHALLELVDRGCPPDLAVRIVAPLDEESAA